MTFPSTVTKSAELFFTLHILYVFPKTRGDFAEMIQHEIGAVTLISHFAPQHLLQLPTNYSHGNPLKKLLSPFHSGKNRDRS